jgi:hypothetical protein
MDWLSTTSKLPLLSQKGSKKLKNLAIGPAPRDTVIAVCEHAESKVSDVFHRQHVQQGSAVEVMNWPGKESVRFS